MSAVEMAVTAEAMEDGKRALSSSCTSDSEPLPSASSDTPDLWAAATTCGSSRAKPGRKALAQTIDVAYAAFPTTVMIAAVSGIQP